MTADRAAVLLVLIAAPAATAVPLLYGWVARRRWFRTFLGWALMTSSAALALLIDVSLLFNFLGGFGAAGEVVRLTVYALIALGAWLTLGAIVRETWRRRGDE